MELQWLENGLDSLGVLLRKCLKWFGTKRTRQICFGLVFAENALFWAEVGVLVFWVFERLVTRVFCLLQCVEIV